MDINEMIETYRISLITEGSDKGNIKIWDSNKVIKDNALEMLRSNKPEIIAELQRRFNATAERNAKIEAIEGLEEIRAAQAAWDKYHDDFDRRMSDENLSSFGISPPKDDVAATKAKYPRAAAYLRAESYSYASNYAKSDAGHKALERIINGEEYTTALADMEKEWSDHCQEHLFD